jgi:uncharacterized protein
MRKLLFLVAVVLAFSLPAFAQSAIEPPLITVSGQAEVRVPPDEVVFKFVIGSVDKDMLTAKKKTDDIVKDVFSAAKKNKVGDEDAQTSYISVAPKYNTDDLTYEQRRTVKRVFVGYEVSETVAVRLKDISRFDELFSDVLKAGVTHLTSVEFLDSQIRKHKDQARVMAIRAAQEKAIALTREIGQSIGPAYSIAEGQAGNRSRNNSFTIDGLDNNNSTTVSGGPPDRESGNAFAPGLISVTAQVTVSFRLQ